MKAYKIINKKKFYSDILQIDKSEIKEILCIKNKNKYYGEPIQVQKKIGFRTIYSVDENNKLYRLQKKLSNNFLQNIMLSDVAYGFVKSTNYVEFLLPHTNFYKSNNYLRLDIKDFFGSITKEDIKDSLQYNIMVEESNEEKNQIIDIIISILTYKGKVIQGAPTSPVLSNIVLRLVDISIEKYCKCFNIVYTRYADDLLFSSTNKYVLSQRFINSIGYILHKRNMNLNYHKCIRSTKYISLNGYVISDSIRLSRKKLKNINRILFYLERNKYKTNDDEYFNKMNSFLTDQDKERVFSFNGVYSLANYLAGYRAYILGILKYSEDYIYTKKASLLINKIEKNLDTLLK